MMNVGVDKVGIRFLNIYWVERSFIVHLSHDALTITGILKSSLCFRQMAEENKNLQSIANESEKRADVEKTGLLDEAEHDD